MALLVAYRIPRPPGVAWRVSCTSGRCARWCRRSCRASVARLEWRLRRAVEVGGFGFQPSEMLKLGVLLFCADLLPAVSAAWPICG